jgi:hypothetical protein
VQLPSCEHQDAEYSISLIVPLLVTRFPQDCKETCRFQTFSLAFRNNLPPFPYLAVEISLAKASTYSQNVRSTTFPYR